MAKKFLTAIDLSKNELQNALIQNLASAPSTPLKGQVYFDTSGNILYWYNGSGWVAAQGGAGAVPATTVTTSAVGDAAVVGVGTTYAREDHKHAREAFANPTGTTTFGLGVVNGSALTLARSDHTHGTPTHDNAAHSAITLNSLAVPTTTVSMNSQRLISLGTPTAGTDATTKDYVDNLSAGLAWKDACRIATTANVTQSGLAAIDGITPIANDRILCKDQSTATQNGIWLAQSGAWGRATDADAVGDLDGATVFIMEGTANADKAFTCTTNAPITPGSTATVWVQFGAGTSYTGGAGILLTGSTFSVGATNASLVISADDIAVGFATSGGEAGTSVQPARGDHVHTAAYVPMARTVSTTAPLAGGGALSGNLTLTISNFTSGAAGAVPASGGAATNFLCADGSWSAPTGTGVPTTRNINTTAPLTGGGNLTADRTLAVSVFASGSSGIVPASGGVTTNFLCADGTWKAVPLDTTTGDTRYTRKYAVNCAAATNTVVNHALGTRDVEVCVYRVASPYDEVEADVEHTDTANVTVKFVTAPAAGEYRIVVQG